MHRKQVQPMGGHRASVELVGEFDDDVMEVVGQSLLSSLFRQQRGRGAPRGMGNVFSRLARITANAKPATQGRSILATKQRRRYLPLGTVAIAAAGTGELAVQAQGAIQGQRLILTTDAAAGEHTVTSITCGYKNQVLATAGTAMPIEAFATDATGSILELDPLSTGQTLAIGIASTAAGATNASGLLIGVTSD